MIYDLINLFRNKILNKYPDQKVLRIKLGLADVVR